MEYEIQLDCCDCGYGDYSYHEIKHPNYKFDNIILELFGEFECESCGCETPVLDRIARLED